MMCLLSVSAKGQGANDKNIFFFDGDGRPVPASGRIIAAGKQETILSGVSYEAGAFHVEFVSDTSVTEGGFYSTVSGAGGKTLGEERREVVCAVLRDLSRLIERPQQSEPVRIQVRGFYQKGNAAAARASSVFIGRTGETGILDGAVWTTLNSGRDAYTGLERAPECHGFIEVNFAVEFNVHYDDIEFKGVDMYTVVLHEMIHALGFGSFILPEGVSAGSRQSTGYYSRYDTYLYVKKETDMIPLVVNTNGCYATQFNPRIGSADLLSDCAEGGANTVVFRHTDGTTEYVYAPSVWQEGGSLSHLYEKCSSIGLVMDPGITAGIAKRAPHEHEVHILCELGYAITGRYGEDSLTGRYGVYEPCGRTTAIGVNDSLGSIISGSTGEIRLWDLIGNDIGATEADCIEIVEGRGELSGSRLWLGDSVVVLTAGEGFYGTLLLRYIPKGTYSGNITYVHIRIMPAPVPPCVPMGCNYVCNGGFEVNSRSGEIRPWEDSLSTSLQGWWATYYTDNGFMIGGRNTPDIWRRLPGLWGVDSLALYLADNYDGIDKEVIGFPGGDYLAPDFPPLNTWDADIHNNHFAGMAGGLYPFMDRRIMGGEALYQQLAKPLQNDGTRYVMEFYATARSIPYFYPKSSQLFAFRIYGDTIDPAPSDTTRPPLSPDYVFGTPVVSVGEWQKVKLGPFTVPSIVDYLHIQGYPEGLPDSTYVYGFIDDVIIREVGIGIDTYVSDSYPCIGEEVTFTFHVCKDDPEDRQTSVSVIDYLPAGLRYTGGDFSLNGSGGVFAVLSPERFDASNCVQLQLRAIVDSTALNNSPLVNSIVPAGMDTTCLDAVGKTKVAVYPVARALTVHSTFASPVCINEYIDAEIEVVNHSILPVDNAAVNIDLGKDLVLVPGSVSVNGIAVQDAGLQHKAYTLVGNRLLFPQLPIQAGSPASGQGLNRILLRFKLRCTSDATAITMPVHVTTVGLFCTVGDTAHTVIHHTIPQPQLPADTSSCHPVLLDAKPMELGSYRFLWSTGDTSRTIEVRDSTTVWVAVTNADGCTGYDTSRVAVEKVRGLSLLPSHLSGEPGQLLSVVLAPEQEEMRPYRVRPFRIRLRFDRRLLNLEWDNQRGYRVECTEIVGNDCIMDIIDTLGVGRWSGRYPEFQFRFLNTSLNETSVVVEKFLWLDCQAEVMIPPVLCTMGNSLPGTIREEPIGAFTLEQNYPNPFREETSVVFEITRRGNVEMIVVDMMGKYVSTLLKGQGRPGRYKLVFHADNLASGPYIVLLKTNEGLLRKTMLLLK